MAQSLEKKLLRACRDCDFNLVRQLIQQGCNPRSVRDDNNYTPLHYACERGGDLGFVKTLVETFSCDPQRKSSWLCETPLHVACRYVAWVGRNLAAIFSEGSQHAIPLAWPYPHRQSDALQLSLGSLTAIE